MTQARTSPYVWVTWLSKLMTGETSCSWAAWFKSHHKDYEKQPSDFDFDTWNTKHFALLERCSEEYRVTHDAVKIERQNSFQYLGGSGAILSGKPDLIAVKGGDGVVADIKTGSPKESDKVQVLIYMWALPKAHSETYGSVHFSGEVVYPNERKSVPATLLNDDFKQRLGALLRRVVDPSEPQHTPSYEECRFCDITKSDCPARVDAAPAPAQAELGDF